MAADGAGGVFVAWQDSRAGYNEQRAYLQHILGSGQVAPGWPANGIATGSSPGEQFDPVIAADGSGGVIVALWDHRDTTRIEGYDIVAQRISGAGEISTGWPAEGLILCSAPGAQTDPSIVQHVDADGVIPSGWPAAGFVFSGGSGNQLPLDCIADGTGGMFAALLSDGCRCARISVNGAIAPGWPPQGAGLSISSQYMTAQSLMTDGRGGLLAVFEDHRDYETQGVDIYTQRVSGAGVPAPDWPRDARHLGIRGPSPNPASADLQLELALPVPDYVSADVFDLFGRRVRSLLTKTWFSVGNHTVFWNGLDDKSKDVRGGLYVIRVWTSHLEAARRIARLH